MAESDRGRCISCGFLSREDQPGDLSEVTPDERRGVVFLAMLPGDDFGPFYPACYRRAHDLFAEALGNDRLPLSNTARRVQTPTAGLATVIEADRQCDKWFAYEPGRSPEQHFDRLQTLDIEKERAAIQLRLGELERDARTSESAIAQAIAHSADSTRRFITTGTYVAVGLAAALVIIAALAVLGVRL